jgi:Flp pilus assembly protein TadD
MTRLQWFLALTISALSWQAQAASYCGNLKNGFGPFDYRNAATNNPQAKMLVESAHFTPEVENLIKGNSSYVGGDLDYTLRAFPNHHRALASMAKLALQTKGTTTSGLKYSFMCYFERAMRFTPDDDGVYMVYGTYLYKRGDVAGAKKQFMQALALNADNVPANYNLGLIYLHEGSYEKARAYAKKAYAADYPVQGLKNGLVAAGKWDAR